LGGFGVWRKRQTSAIIALSDYGEIVCPTKSLAEIARICTMLGIIPIAWCDAHNTKAAYFKASPSATAPLAPHLHKCKVSRLSRTTQPSRAGTKIIIVSAGLFAFAAGALPPHPRDTKARNEIFGQ
jgi:hypothetical protein